MNDPTVDDVDSLYQNNLHERYQSENTVGGSQSHRKQELLQQYLTGTNKITSQTEKTDESIVLGDDYNILIELNRPKFQRIFSLLSQSNNQRVTYPDIHKFTKITNVSPDLIQNTDLKKIVCQVIFGNDKSPLSNTQLINFEQFEKIVLEIAQQTLHLAHSREERLKIFMMHIKNPCRMHYQISNFVFDKNRMNSSIMTSTTRSKIMKGDHDNISMVDNKSERSMNFFINPLISNGNKNLTTYTNPVTADVSPIKGSQQLGMSAERKNSSNSTFQHFNNQLLNFDNQSVSRGLSQNPISENKSSFISDNNQSNKFTPKTNQGHNNTSSQQQIDENIETALKQLKKKKEAHSNNGSIEKKRQEFQDKKKDLLYQQLKLSSGQKDQIKPYQQKNQQTNKLTSEASNQAQSQIVLSPQTKTNNPLLNKTDNDVNNNNASQKSQKNLNLQTFSPQYQKPSSQASKGDNELKEFLEIEKQIDTTLQTTRQRPTSITEFLDSLQSPSSAQAKIQVKNKNAIQENSNRLKSKLNEIESTNFTFVENKGGIASKNQGLKTARVQSSQEIRIIEERKTPTPSESLKNEKQSNAVKNALQSQQKRAKLKHQQTQQAQQQQMQNNGNKANFTSRSRKDSKEKSNSRNTIAAKVNSEDRIQNSTTSLNSKTGGTVISVNAKIQKTINQSSSVKKIDYLSSEAVKRQSMDPLELALQKEESRKQKKIQQMNYYSENKDKLMRMVERMIKIQLKAGFNCIKQTKPRRKPINHLVKKLFCRSLNNIVGNKLKITLLGSFAKIQNYAVEQKNANGQKDERMISLLTCRVFSRINEYEDKKDAFQKIKENYLTMQINILKKQIKNNEKKEKESQLVKEQLDALQKLNLLFKQRISDL